MPKFVYMAFDDVKISVLKVFGYLGVKAMNDHYMEHLSENPKRWTYDALFDLRKWEGMATDLELSELALDLKIKRWEALGSQRVPKVVFVGSPESGLRYLAENLAKIRGAEVYLEHSPQAAWERLAPPGTPIPQVAKSLFER